MGVRAGGERRAGLGAEVTMYWQDISRRHEIHDFVLQDIIFNIFVSKDLPDIFLSLTDKSPYSQKIHT